MRLMVRSAPSETGLPYSSEPGDVLAIVPDSHVWSLLEMNNPTWLRIESNINQADADMLMEQSPPGGPPILRVNRINITGLSNDDVVPRAVLLTRTYSV
jgi:hypothetical protein